MNNQSARKSHVEKNDSDANIRDNIKKVILLFVLVAQFATGAIAQGHHKKAMLQIKLFAALLLGWSVGLEPTTAHYA